jgi:hypothetical protein
VAHRRLLRVRVASPSVSTGTDIESARRDWEDGYRRLIAAAARDPVEADRLHRQLDVVTGELRRRVGSTFTVAELARAYPDSERWTRTAVEESGAPPGWARSLAMAGDAAFHLYARGAVDYAP